MKLTILSVTMPGLASINEAMDTFGYELSSPMRSMQTFSYAGIAGAVDIDDRVVIRELLKPVAKLRNLTLMLDKDDFFFNGELEPVIPGVFLANNFAHLETLEIGYMDVAGVDLVAVLSQCRSTMRSIHIHSVSVKESDSLWFEVFATCSTMPYLSSATLERLGVIDQYYLLFDDLMSGPSFPGRCLILRFKGQLEVAAGLKDLLEARFNGSYRWELWS
jgi:hypothetical protein